MPDLDALNIHVPIKWLHDETINKMATTPQEELCSSAVANALMKTETKHLSTPGEQASTPHEDDDDFRTKTLKGALDSGQYGLGGNLNKVWKLALNRDPKLKGDYAAVGKKHTAQQEFRQRWVSTMYDQITRHKTKTESSGTITSNEGEWLPFDIIIDREGGEHRPQAVAAALSYAMCCVRFHTTGSLAGNRAPWMLYNDMTHRWEFLYLCKNYKDWFQDSFKLCSQMSESSTSTQMPQSPAETQLQTPEHPPKPKAASKQAPKRIGNQPEEVPPSAKKQNTGMTPFFKKLMKLRNDMAMTMSTA